MNRNIFFIAFVFLSITVPAQKKKLTIEESQYLIPKKILANELTNIQWIPGTPPICSFLKDEKKIIYFNLKTQQTDTVISADNSFILKHISSFKPISKDLLFLQSPKLSLIYDLENKLIANRYTLPDDAQNLDFNVASKNLAYTVRNNLIIATTKNQLINVTNDEDENIVNGQFVSRNEFGIEKGTFWSASGDYLAFYIKDLTDVTTYPIVNIDTRIASSEPVKYPMAGMGSEHLSIGVYNIKTGKTIFIEKENKSEKYLTCVTWDPSGKYIFIAVLNRQQNHLKFNKYDVVSGKLVKTLFEETHAKYVEPRHPVYFLKNQPDQFIWNSRRSGFNHLYLYNTEGQLIKQLTSGNWEVTDVIGTDRDESMLFFVSTRNTPLERNLYRLDIEKGNITMISRQTGIHEAQISPENDCIVDYYKTQISPQKIDLLDYNGQLLKEVNTIPDYFSDYENPTIEIGKIKAADDTTDLYYRVIEPYLFNPAKKYPVIVTVYGGPHKQSIDNSWMNGASAWDFYMANRGFIIFCLDNRGSDNRGLDFENVIFRHLGNNETADQMKGIEWLKKQAYADTNRIGVYGWSFGGFMSISLMLHAPKTFKVGVAGGPVIDWKYYEVMYGERYMGTPQENPDGYENSSLIKKVKYLNGKLLIIHGALDPVVVWQNSLSFIQECIKQDKQVDYFFYPHQEHNVKGYEKVNLMKKITNYFIDNLKPIN